MKVNIYFNGSIYPTMNLLPIRKRAKIRVQTGLPICQNKRCSVVVSVTRRGQSGVICTTLLAARQILLSRGAPLRRGIPPVVYIYIYKILKPARLCENVGFWASRQPNPQSGECVDVRVTDDQHQSWELTTCESLLPFMCRASACPAGNNYTS